MSAPASGAAPTTGSGLSESKRKQPEVAAKVDKEKVALEILKKLAAEAGMRARDEKGHRKRPNLDEMQAELMRYVKRGKAAFDADANEALLGPSLAVSREASSASTAAAQREDNGFAAGFLPSQLKNAPKHVAKFPDGVPQLCGTVVGDPPKWVVIGSRTSCPTNSVLCVRHNEAILGLKDSTHVFAREAYECKAIDTVMAESGMPLDYLRQYRVATYGPSHGVSVADMKTPMKVKVFFGVRECVVYDVKKLGKAPIVVQETGLHKSMHHVDSGCIRRDAEAR